MRISASPAHQDPFRPDHRDIVFRLHPITQELHRRFDRSTAIPTSAETSVQESVMQCERGVFSTIHRFCIFSQRPRTRQIAPLHAVMILGPGDRAA